MNQDQPGGGRDAHAKRQHSHVNRLAGGKLVPSEALDADGTPSASTFLRGDDSWAEIPETPAAEPAPPGFDPNESPVIIGHGASAGAGSTPDDVSAGAARSVALGWSAFLEVAATSSVAVGDSAYCALNNAVAVGSSADSEGEDAITIGNGALAGDWQSLAIGRNAHAVAPGAIAIGGGEVQGPSTNNGRSEVKAGADNSVALGPNAVVDTSCTNCVAIGANSQANASSSTAIGANAATDRANQIKLGDGEVVEIAGSGNGLALRSPDGTRYVLSVSNAGALVITATP